MAPELTALGLAALAQAAQTALYAAGANRDLGAPVTLGPRDDPRFVDRLSARTGRLRRAHANHAEALILFTIAVYLVIETDSGTRLTATLAWVYLGARIAYVAAYWSGVPVLRSVVWMAGFLPTLAMIIIALFP